MSTITEDTYLADGTRLFNPTKPHGTVYSDGFSDARFSQNGVLYRGDGKPVGYEEVNAAPAPLTKPLGLKAPGKV